MKEKNDLINQEEEILKLVEEIRNLKDKNEEKQIKIENTSKEYETLKLKLSEIERNGLMYQSLSEEDELEEKLGIRFKCGKCDEKYGSPFTLKLHMKNVHETRKNAMRMKSK